MSEQKELVPTKFGAIRDLLVRQKTEIEKALPRHINADRMLRIALTECRKNPELLDCDRASFLGAIIQSSQLGLEPGSALGHSYLIPFNNSKRGIREVQLIVGYRGMIDLISRADNAPTLVPRAVYEGDEFSYELGLSPILTHRPAKDRDPKAKLTHVYVVAEFKDGRKVFDVMSRADIDKIRKNTHVWRDYYEEMAKKTVIRHLFKYLPTSVELQRAISLDEQADSGESQKNETFVPTQTDPESKSERVERAIESKSKDPADFENF